MKKLVFLVVMLGIANVQADTVFYKTEILRTSQSPGANGGCLARLEIGPATQGLLDCNDKFVSFDCDGGFGSKSEGQALFNAAQASMFVSTGDPSILVTDSHKYGTICVAKQIDVRP